MSEAIEINNVNKVYSNGFVALKEINLKIHSGEIFALLGPNGAGKSTLINIICGLTKKNTGEISIFNFDNEKSYKQARSLIGLVPQEIATDSFEKVINTIRFTRGLFNKINSEEYIESILKKLSLWEKKDQQIRTLSGGMKRRLMIAKAMSHEPKILFLDEPTAGVDVELRKSMWEQIIKLKQLGVTIVLTTHYIEEAEKIADRIGIIDKGEIILVENKKDILKKLGNRKLIFSLTNEINSVPRSLKHLDIIVDKKKIICFVDKTNEKKKLSKLIKDFAYNSIEIENIEIEENTLEDIFIELVKK